MNPPSREDVMRLSPLIVAALIVMPSIAPAQDVAAGEKVFAQCKTCHQIGEAAKNAVGPVLNGVIGRKAGTIEGFKYSEANKNSGIVWSEAQFLEYIKDPKAKIPATKMVFTGIKNEAEAKSLWAFLSQFGADGKKK